MVLSILHAENPVLALIGAPSLSFFTPKMPYLVAGNDSSWLCKGSATIGTSEDADIFVHLSEVEEPILPIPFGNQDHQ